MARPMLRMLLLAVVSVVIADGPASAQASRCPYGYQEAPGKATTCSCTAEDAQYDGRLLGTEVYTADSHVCKAARHMGFIGPSGGPVQVIGAPEQPSFVGSTRNGITSGNYGNRFPAFRVAQAGVAQPPPPPPPTQGYVGCFRDPNNPFDLQGHLERSAQNTPQRCVATCRQRGFPYAGVQYGESCLCGNSYGNFGAATNCTMPCTGDRAQVCGGSNANSVYATGIAPAKGVPKMSSRPVGCFKDGTNPYDLDGFLQRSNDNTPQRCATLCAVRGFRYAGVQYGESCLCGNSYGRYGPANNCTMACTGDRSLACGGYGSNSVYEITIQR